tara:strand:+ start:1320 stop:1634 length:315 start_codon:yes stop_codon:yes gene_type:complete
MPNAKYFLSLGGSFLLGLVVIIASIILGILLAPFIIPLLPAIFLGMTYILAVILVIFILFVIFYVITLVGVVVRYLFKPMKVSKENKNYNIDKVKESGRRQKSK